MKRKVPTCTFKILQALREADDFMSADMISAKTGCDRNQISASLHHLRTRAKVVDVVVNPDGRGWWFALPEDMDTRSIIHEERTPESRPRRQRKALPV